MVHTVTVARASLEDAPLLVPLFEAYRDFYMKEPDAEGAARFLRDRFARNEAVMFLARAENVPVGFTLLYPLFSSTRLRSLWLLNDLFVTPTARGWGAGSALMHAARQFALSNGAVGLTLRTARDNVTAQRLYEALGYERNTDFYTYDLTL